MRPAAIAVAVALTVCATPGMASTTSGIESAAMLLDRAAARKNPSPSDVPDIRVASSLEPWLAASLDAARKEKKSAARASDMRALAASLRRASALENAPLVSEPRDVSSVVKKILSDPAFAVPHTAPPAAPRQSWLAALLQRLIDLWSKFIGRAAERGMASAGFGDIIAIVAVAVAVAALLYLISRLALLLVERRARRTGDVERGLAIAAPLDPDQTYDEARRAARDGLFGRAVTLLFQAALVTLDRSGRIAYDPARTAGEYRRAVQQAAGRASAPFDDLARAFTEVVYADKTISERDWMSADASFSAFAPLVGFQR